MVLSLLRETRGPRGRRGVGNIGQGADGHIVDEYEVPCQPEAVRVYVDAYHCPKGVHPPDGSNLTPAQLARLAKEARTIERHPFHPRASKRRRGLVEFFVRSKQISVPICSAMMAELPGDNYAHASLIKQQFVASLGAAVIDRGDRPEDPHAENIAAFMGVARLYDTMMAQKGAARVKHAALDSFTAMVAEKTLSAHVAKLVKECSAPVPTMSMKAGGRNVWPPKGPECPRLVSCCEDQGLVLNGAAVADTAGLHCLVAAAIGSGDCTLGLQMLEGVGLQCP